MLKLHKTPTPVLEAWYQQIHAELERRRASEIDQRPGEIERRIVREWTYILQRVCCGKGNCRRCGGRNYTHGPYWYAYRRMDGKLMSHYVGKQWQPVDSHDGFDNAEQVQ